MRLSFRLVSTPHFDDQAAALPADVFEGLSKALRFLETNPRHPGLNTHKFNSLKGPGGEEVFEAYAENRTPAAYRIFWHYGPGQDVITVVAITPHP